MEYGGDMIQETRKRLHSRDEDTVVEFNIARRRFGIALHNKVAVGEESWHYTQAFQKRFPTILTIYLFTPCRRCV
jgi:hypothetical protein